MNTDFKMNHLKIESSKRACVFVLQIQSATDTLRRLAMFFADHWVEIDNLQMHRFPGGEAMLIIHCQIEKENVLQITESLQQMPGIIKLERMEAI